MQCTRLLHLFWKEEEKKNVHTESGGSHVIFRIGGMYDNRDQFTGEEKMKRTSNSNGEMLNWISEVEIKHIDCVDNIPLKISKAKAWPHFMPQKCQSSIKTKATPKLVQTK